MREEEILALSTYLERVAATDARRFVAELGMAFDSWLLDWDGPAFEVALEAYGIQRQALPSELEATMFMVYSHRLERETKRLIPGNA